MAVRLSDKELNSLEQKLSKQYASEQKRLQRKVTFELVKFNVQDKSRQLLVDNGLMKQETYDDWRRAELSHSRRINRIVDGIANDMLKLNQRSADAINKSNKKVYQDSYKSGLKDVGVKKTDKGNFIPRSKINEQKDLNWNKQKLSSMLMQSISRGEDAEQIAKRLSGIADMNKYSAIRSARTLTTGAENEALLESYRAAKAAGVPIKKVWKATLDERTRISHRGLNNEVRELEEPFSNGLMYPGDPSGEAKEIFNCRCRLGSSLAES